MRKHKIRKFLWYTLLALGLILLLYVTRILPLPIVPVFNGNRGWVVGFLTCRQLESKQWETAFVSGEYFARDPLFGVAYPYIYGWFFARDCPSFHPGISD